MRVNKLEEPNCERQIVKGKSGRQISFVSVRVEFLFVLINIRCYIILYN